MNKKTLSTILIITGLVVLFAGIRQCTPKISSMLGGNGVDSRGSRKPGTLKSHADVHSGNPVGAFLNAYETPIELYGKVVDQHGKPIEGANVTVHAHGKPFCDGSAPVARLTSGADGGFSMLGLKGFQLAVMADKKGFIYYSPLGGPASTSLVSQSTTPKSPLVLTLHDPGPMEPLVHVPQKLWNLPSDGAPRRIALNSEKGVGVHQIEFRFISEWRNLPQDNEINSKLFNWSFEARIPGGGFIQNKRDLNMKAVYQFEAPEEPYQETIKYDFPASIPNRWKVKVKDSFFVKFPDGTYGRIRFDVEGFTDQTPLYMETFWNPKPGSRNLSSLYK